MSWTNVPKEFISKRDNISPQFSCTPQGPTSTRFFIFDWADIASGAAQYGAMGYVGRTGPGPLGLTRFLPERDPQFQNLWASNFSFHANAGSKGYATVTVNGQPRRIPIYTKAVYRVDYSWRPYRVLSDSELDALDNATEYERFVEIREDDQSDYISPAILNNGGVMQWVKPGTDTVNHKPAVTTIGKLIPYANLSMTWHQVPYKYFPLDAIRASVGKVTKKDLGVSPDKNFYAKGTLLFCGARFAVEFSSHSETDQWDQWIVSPQYFWRYDPDGPNTFPCFLKDAFAERLLISKDGNDHAIGSRDGFCIYREFDPIDVFSVT